MGSIRSKREIDSSLRKKGFHRAVGGNHILYTLSGFGEIKTLMSHGAKSESLSADLLSRMARQLHLTKTQFLDLIDCTLDEENYREIVSDQSID